jgi:hypothetical protein
MRYICVRAMALRPQDRIIEYGNNDNLSFTIDIAKWVYMPHTNYRGIQIDGTHQDGEQEILFLRAHTPVWIWRK